MTVAVVVPFTGSDVHRLRAGGWIEARYRTLHPGWDIITGSTDGPWSKARAVTDALTRTDAETLIVADADCWCPDLAQHVEAVAIGGREFVFPHWHVVRLNETATDEVFTTGDLPDAPRRDQLDQAPYVGRAGGGIVVLTRDLYDRVPLDPRFEGWGGEDESWGRALLTMSRNHVRGDGPLYHLWHTPQQRLNRKFGSEASAELTERYRQAAGDQVATLALIEEGRCSTTSSHAT